MLTISPAEWEVMRVLWAKGQATSSEIIEILAKKLDWSASTVKTLIGRLADKGYLTSQRQGRGFIYAVAINGVTGKTGNYRDDLDKHLSNLTAYADIPVLTGFGVSTEEDIKRFNAVSDGVIVGSKIVRDLHDGKEEDVTEFVKFGSHFEK